MKEIWKDVVGYEALYMVSNIGRIKGLLRRKLTVKKKYIAYLKEKFIKPSPSGPGQYPSVVLSKDGEQKQFFVHRLVLTAFVGLPFHKAVCNHKNGIRNDNRVENLEWVTQTENNRHTLEVLGKSTVGSCGEDNMNAKLNWNKVDKIRKLYALDPKRWNCYILADKFGVTASTINKVILRRTWNAR